MSTSDKILTYTAVFISCLALVVSIVQTRILQRQSKASVWPRLELLDSSGPEHFRLFLENHGVGPAIVTDVVYGFQDTTFTTIYELFDYVAYTDARANQISPDSLGLKFTFSGIYEGRVLTPNESIEIFEAMDPAAVRLANAYFYEVDFRIDYCSIYEECWRLTGDSVEEL